MSTFEHFQAGRLSDAVASAISDVKSAPTDLGKRTVLAEMLCYTGDLERADKHLETLAQQNPELGPGVALFRQLIRAEQARRQFFEEGRVPEIVQEPSASLRARLEASVMIRDGDFGGARISLDQANAHPLPGGTVDDVPCEYLRDLDDLVADVFEVLTPNGKYYLIPMEQVISLEMRKPESPRELMWRPAEMTVRDGPEGEVYLPTLYHGSHKAEDDATKLGRATQWLDQGGITRGCGQRMLLVGEEARSILELNEMQLQPSSVSRA